MNELFAAMLSYLPLTLAPLLLMLLAPAARRGTRLGFGIVLAVGSAVLAVAALTQIGVERELQVTNPFAHPERDEPVVYVMEVVTAPGWRWPLLAAFFLAVPAWQLIRLRHRKPRPPPPVFYATLLTVWYFAARLALEKSAAPEALTWALGITLPTLLVLPFFGSWCAARNLSFGRFVGELLLLAVVQRTVVVAWSYLATTRNLGTHLDMSAVEQVTLPLFGAHDFTGAGDPSFSQWLWLGALPQYTLWVVLTMAAGLVLGGATFWLARRQIHHDFSTTLR